MRISALSLHGNWGWPNLKINSTDLGLNVVYGPAGSGKSTLADFISHALYGRRLVASALDDIVKSPDGEIEVDAGGRCLRLRRYHDHAAAERLTVAALDDSPVDHETVRQLSAGVSQSLLGSFFVVSHRELRPCDRLLSLEFDREFRAAIGDHEVHSAGPRQTALLERRDALAKELELQIVHARVKTQQLNEQWRALDGEIESHGRELEQLRHQLRGVETELAGINTQLRCRQLQSAVNHQWQTADPDNWESRLQDLDGQIERLRATVAELDARGSAVRAQLAQVDNVEGAHVVQLADQQACLSVTRELVSDLQGEVARLARADLSKSCICNESHPRLRPIVDTISEQLGTLANLVGEQQLAVRGAELREESDLLARSQVELDRQLQHLLGCRHALIRSVKTVRRPNLVEQLHGRALYDPRQRELFLAGGTSSIQELTAKRADLQRQRGQVHDQLAELDSQLDQLRRRRRLVEQERADSLTARSIDDIQRQLASVQQQLEQSSQSAWYRDDAIDADENAMRASDYLAQLTDGELVRLQLARYDREPQIVTCDGEFLTLGALSAAGRDQVYLSVSLALVAECGRHGIRLPLVLDEPFARLDRRATAALAAVLDEFCSRGHQVFVFTSSQDAVDRFASIDATLYDLVGLQHDGAASPVAFVSPVAVQVTEATRRAKRRTGGTERTGSDAVGKHREAG